MKLKEYLDNNGIKYNLFAKRLGVSVITLYNVFKGQDIKISTALKIYYLTDKYITPEDLAPKNFKKPKAFFQ